MLLIINLGIIFSLLIIVLFNIVNTRKQVLLSLGILILLFLFKIVCDKLILNNRQNVDYRSIYNTENNLITNNKVNLEEDNSTNSFNLKNLDNILIDMKNIRNQENKIDRINVKNNNYVFTKDSGNGDYHYKDLHNKILNVRLNTSDKHSLLLNNVDCSNDNSCIIDQSIYNFHKY
jgi:hypothetical protein